MALRWMVASSSLLLGCANMGQLRADVEATEKAELKRAGENLANEAKQVASEQAKRLGNVAARAAGDAVGALVSGATNATLDAVGVGRASVTATSSEARSDVALPDWQACAAAPEVPEKEISELATLVLTRAVAHAVASVKFCEYRARRSAAEDTIRHEREAKKYSGVVDDKRIHDAGVTMAEMETSSGRLGVAMVSHFGAPASECSGGVAAVANCLAEVGSCRDEANEVRAAWPMIEGTLMHGVPVFSREEQLKKRLGAVYVSTALKRAQAVSILLTGNPDGILNIYGSRATGVPPQPY